MNARHRPLSRLFSRFAPVVLLLLLTPIASLAAPAGAPAQAPNAKSVSPRLADVTRVLGRGLTIGKAGYTSKPSAMGACTSTPPVTDYTADFYGPLRTKGVLNVVSTVYTYRSASGPICNQQIDISTYRVLGGTLGKLTTVRGVGGQAFLVDTTGPKTQGPVVYTLALKFTRGLYRAIIVVQSNKAIKAADMIKLARVVDGRMLRTG